MYPQNTPRSPTKKWEAEMRSTAIQVSQHGVSSGQTRDPDSSKVKGEDPIPMVGL